MGMNINSRTFPQASPLFKGSPMNGSSPLNSRFPQSSPSQNQSNSAFDLSMSADVGLPQQLNTVISLIKTILESLGQSGGLQTPSAKKSPKADSTFSADSTSEPSSKRGAKSKDIEGDNTQPAGASAPKGGNTNLPAINPGDWSARDGKNGEEFATPFASKNIIKNGNSITSQMKGNEGSEATLNKKIVTGFYQMNVNPKLTDQTGDIPTVFFYSGKGSKGQDVEGGFELDAEYNMNKPGTVTFGTWIDGKKYNEVVVPAPKGDQTIGFNIQDGITQIGFVNPDGTFEPKSETRDERITPELASNLQAMTNTWRSKSSGAKDNGETSSITINGFGRSEKPGEPAEAV